MKILHVCDENSRTGSGVYAAVFAYVAAVKDAHQGVEVAVAAPAGEQQPAPPGVELVALPSTPWMKPFRGGMGMRQVLQRAAADATVLHVHSVWMAPEISAGRWAVRAGRPWVVSTHGMLQPAEMARRRLKKSIFWRTIAAPIFARATVVHAITTSERDTLHRLLPHAEVAVIPNALDLARADSEGAGAEQPPEPGCLMFYGRVTEGKGVEELICAFAQARLPSGWRLEVVGPCSPDYQQRLERVAAAAQVAERVEFVPAVRGAEKWERLKRAWLAAMPSRSEVVGMANLEAAAAGVPTLVTPAAGLQDWEESGGLMEEPEVAALARRLQASAGWSEGERRQRGTGLRKLVERRYTTTVTGKQFLELYQRLSGEP